MSYIKSFLVVAVVLLFAGNSWAADVDATAAQAMATSYFQSRHPGKLMSPGNVNLRLVHTERSATRAGSVAYYVFNADDAFVIVAGDDRAERILARGDHALDMNNIPPNMQCILNQYKTQIDFLADQAPTTEPRRARARTASIIIDPLTTSRWDQSEPYYNLCPEMNGKLCLTGCTATAMAQVMYYWKYPDSLPALPAYYADWSFLVPELPGAELHWDDMLDVYTRGHYTEAQADAVATLMRYCGQAAFMEYTPSQSGATEMHALLALQQFGYDHESECLSRFTYGRDQWIDMILEDLLADRPVLYFGYTETTGHAFILDGYDGELFHVNWGWSGTSDGYFALDALGSGLYEFNYYQVMLHHLYPDPQGSNMMPTYDFESSGIYYKQAGDSAIVVNDGSLAYSYSGVVNIPETVTHDGQTLTVTAIGEKAFQNCDGLKEVVLPSTVTSIGRYAFAYCSDLRHVRLNGGNKTFGAGAFSMCYDVEYVYVDDVETWLSMTFNDLDANPLYYNSYLVNQNGALIQDVVVPASIGKVTDNAFAWYEHMRSVTLEEGVTSIGDNAFFACSNIRQVIMPTTLRTIGQFAFESCMLLREINLPASLTSIGMYAFDYCVELTHVEIPDGITSLPDGAFNGCLYMTSIDLPAGLTELGENALSYCEALTSVSLPLTVARIGKETFAGDISLSQVTLSDNLEAIPARAFYGCSSLQEISLPAGVKWIGKEAFGSNSSLTAVGISPGVERIEASAFKSCSNLARVDISDLASWCNITFADPQANPLYMARRLYLDGEELHDMAIPAGVKSINDYAFSRYEGLTSLTMSNDVESIGEEAFLGCKQMTSATIGNGVRTIGEKAFNGCSKLTDVTFGSRVDSVGMYSFGSCNALTKITSRAITPPYMRGTGSFSDKAYKNATVYVPRQSLEEYKVALVWKRFSHLEGVNFKAERADVNGDGEVTIADVNCLIDALLWGTFSDSFDVNEDGELTIADVNAVIDVILTGQ